MFIAYFIEHVLSTLCSLSLTAAFDGEQYNSDLQLAECKYSHKDTRPSAFQAPNLKQAQPPFNLTKLGAVPESAPQWALETQIWSCPFCLSLAAAAWWEKAPWWCRLSPPSSGFLWQPLPCPPLPLQPHWLPLGPAPHCAVVLWPGDIISSLGSQFSCHFLRGASSALPDPGSSPLTWGQHHACAPKQFFIHLCQALSWMVSSVRQK